jgi:hypothetical protein
MRRFEDLKALPGSMMLLQTSSVEEHHGRNLDASPSSCRFTVHCAGILDSSIDTLHGHGQPSRTLELLLL